MWPELGIVGMGITVGNAKQLGFFLIITRLFLGYINGDGQITHAPVGYYWPAHYPIFARLIIIPIWTTG